MTAPDQGRIRAHAPSCPVPPIVFSTRLQYITIMLMIFNALPGIRPALKTAAVLITAAIVLSAAACKINPTPPDRYALVYGVSDYSNRDPADNLEYTDDDARSVAEMLHSKGYEVYLRINNESGTYPYAADVASATKQQFITDITTIAGSLNKSDLILIYFSGHGAQGMSESSGDEDQFSEPRDEYIVFYPDSGQTEPEYVMSDTDFFSQLKQSAPKKRVVMIDACNSGGFIGSEYDYDAIQGEYSITDSRSGDIMSSTLDAFFAPKTGDIPSSEAIVITAAGESEVSFETSGHGFLTFGFLYSATYGDYDNNNYIDTGEVYRYTRTYIETHWNSLWNGYSGSVQEYYQFMPHISGGPVDYILFKAE